MPPAGGGIVRVVATSGDLTGSIEARSLGAAPPNPGIDIAGDIKADINLVSNILSPIEAGGDLVGDITAGEWIRSGTVNNYTGSITIDGDMLGDVTIGKTTITEPPGDGATDGPVTIHGAMVGDLTFDQELNSDVTITAANGLQGQIIINASNVSGGDWLADASVDTITIGPLESDPDAAPHYDRLSSELGAGAIGLAPFNFHQRESAPPTGETRDCDPYHTETVQLGPLDDLNSVRVRHYGPVYVDGAGPHFRVEFKPRWIPSVWTDKTSLFEVDTGLTGTDEASATNDVYLKPTAANKNGFKTAGYWRIRPLNGKVKCANVNTNPNVEWDSSVVSGDLGSSSGTQYDWYAFDVLTYLALSSSAPVIDGDQVNAWDLTAWPIEPFETNADGETDLTDFVDMADAYNN